MHHQLCGLTVKKSINLFSRHLVSVFKEIHLDNINRPHSTAIGDWSLRESSCFTEKQGRGLPTEEIKGVYRR